MRALSAAAAVADNKVTSQLRSRVRVCRLLLLQQRRRPSGRDDLFLFASSLNTRAQKARDQIKVAAMF